MDFKVLFAVDAVAAVRLTYVWQSELFFQAKAIEALQHAAEDYLVRLFEDVSLICFSQRKLAATLLTSVAGEFGGDSRQAYYHFPKRYSGLGHCNTLPIFCGMLISSLCRLRDAFEASGHKSVVKPLWRHFIKLASRREAAAMMPHAETRFATRSGCLTLKQRPHAETAASRLNSASCLNSASVPSLEIGTNLLYSERHVEAMCFS
jgi:hypothetical protein